MIDFTVLGQDLEMLGANPQFLMYSLAFVTLVGIVLLIKKKKTNKLDRNTDSINLSYTAGSEMTHSSKSLDGMVETHVKEFPEYFQDEGPSEITFPKTVQEMRPLKINKDSDAPHLYMLLNEAIQEDVANNRNKAYSKLLEIEKNDQIENNDRKMLKIIIQGYREKKSLLELLKRFPLSIDKNNYAPTSVQEKNDSDWLSSFGTTKQELTAKQWDFSPNNNNEINSLMDSIAKEAEYEESLAEDETVVAQKAIADILKNEKPSQQMTKENKDSDKGEFWKSFSDVVTSIKSETQPSINEQLKVDLSMNNTDKKYEYWVNWMCLVNGKASLKHNFVTFSSPWGKRTAITELFDFLTKQAGLTNDVPNQWSILSVHKVED